MACLAPTNQKMAASDVILVILKPSGVTLTKGSSYLYLYLLKKDTYTGCDIAQQSLNDGVHSHLHTNIRARLCDHYYLSYAKRGDRR